MAVAAAQQQQQGAGSSLPTYKAGDHQFLTSYGGSQGGFALSSTPGSSSMPRAIPTSNYTDSFRKGSGAGGGLPGGAGGGLPGAASAGGLVSRERSTSAPNVCIHNTNILFDSHYGIQVRMAMGYPGINGVVRWPQGLPAGRADTPWKVRAARREGGTPWNVP
jgi:hypothetical protein